MKRREFIAALGLTIAGPWEAVAQIFSKDFHVGTVTPGIPIGHNSPAGQILLRVVAERGYRLGENLTFHSRGAMPEIHLLPQMLEEMKANRVQVVIIPGHPTAVAA